MLKRPFFRTPFWNQHVHGSRTLIKSTRRSFFSNFTLIKEKLSHNTAMLVRSEMLGLFGNTLTADHHRYSPHNGDKFLQQVQTPLSPKIEKCSGIFFATFSST